MIPSAVVSMATTETPMCTGRARDAYYERASPASSLYPTPTGID